MGYYYEKAHFVLLYGAIIYFGFFAYNYEKPTDALDAKSNQQNIFRGIVAMIAVIVSQAMLQPYADSIFKPFEKVWRAVAGICSCYLYFLVFLLFQNPNFARKIIMPTLQPSLGEPHIDPLYDEACEITWANISRNVDLYFFFHCINWVFAAWILRDSYLLHFWSVLDEILELTAQHKMAHLRECWFDHVFLDVLIANTSGIMVGMLTLKILKLETYDWLGREGKKSWRDWDIWTCHRRIGAVLDSFLIICLNFYGGFFFTDTLWIYPTDALAVWRVTFWFLVGMLSFNETYRDVKTWGKEVRRNNPVAARFRWLTFAICLIEILITIKFHEGSPNYLDNPTPLYVIIPWAVVLVLSFGMYFYQRFRPGHTEKYPKEQVFQKLQNGEAKGKKPKKKTA